MIFFVGSVFSPWYAWAGRKNPLDHCCVNILLSGPGGRWSMTERGEGALERRPTSLRIGPSALSWDGEALTAHLDERAFPRLDRIRGTITLRPSALTDVEATLDAAGRHVWRPFAPMARAEVRIDRPGWSWDGEGYFDANAGSRPLEADFRRWQWSCQRGPEAATCFYDVEDRVGGKRALALRFGADGAAQEVPSPPPALLETGFWRLRRSTRADAGARPRTVRTLLDAPFYVRASIRTQVSGEEGLAMHETVDLDRFANPLVRALLAFRIPRVPGPRRRDGPGRR